MKKYLLFAGRVYYPAGGWHDFVDSFDTIDEAKAKAIADDDKDGYGWYQVVDWANNKIEISTVIKLGD